MMNIRSVILKILNNYEVSEFIRLLYLELETDAAHSTTIGAPMKAAYLIAQAGILRETVQRLDAVPYVTPKALQ